jgi:hypothetical protein
MAYPPQQKMVRNHPLFAHDLIRAALQRGFYFAFELNRTLAKLASECGERCEWILDGDGSFRLGTSPCCNAMRLPLL